MKNFNRKKIRTNETKGERTKGLKEINTMLLLEGNDLNEMSETLQKKFLSIIDN